LTGRYRGSDPSAAAQLRINRIEDSGLHLSPTGRHHSYLWRAPRSTPVENGCFSRRTRDECPRVCSYYCRRPDRRALARAWIDAHVVTDEELQLTREEKAVLRDDVDGSDPHGIKWQLAGTVAAFCDCEVWRQGSVLQFCGMQSDVDWSVWLLDHLTDFVQAEVVGPPDDDARTSQRAEGDYQGFRGWLREPNQ
jgi:hypothetical protein